MGRRSTTLRVLALAAVMAIVMAGCTSHKKSAATKPAKEPEKAETTGAVRTPTFAKAGQLAPTVKVLASAAPTLILQFPLSPASLRARFPDATGLVTVTEGQPEGSAFDTVTVTVDKMPPHTKYTVFLTESSATPFGHAEYLGDLFTRDDGSGESTFRAIVLAAFAADNRTPGVSNDESGQASGIQLEHLGLWFDSIDAARTTLQDPKTAPTPFDGGPTPQHAGPQAMTDGQTLPVI